MKKATLLNAPLSAVISEMGHTDTLCIGDAGLPIPQDVERIDLAVTKGTPSFMDVFLAVVSELYVEKVTLATEIKKISPKFHKELIKAIDELGKKQGKKIDVAYVPHAKFKEQTRACRAVARTGETTPYANIILHSGVTF